METIEELKEKIEYLEKIKKEKGLNVSEDFDLKKLKERLVKNTFHSNKAIIIDLDNIRARKVSKENDNHFYLKTYYKKISDLIKVRIKELDERGNKSGKKEFLDYRMNDSILIYGTRGNGKSTIMVNLKEQLESSFKKENYPIKVLDTIDPTVLEPKEEFLIIVLSTIMNAVEQYHKNDSSLKDDDEHLREKFYHLLEDILKKIESARPDGEKSEIFDRFYGDKTGAGLASALHDLFYVTISIFDVKVLLLPIDDIDMNMIQGYSIAETIRKYLASPYIIPIVTFNLKQMRAIAKFNKYKAFGLELTDKEVDNYDDLDFLYSIPSDYLASVFPPDRRIFLKSIYDVLRHYENMGEIEDIEFSLSILENENKKKDRTTINSQNILKLIMNIVFEHYLDGKFIEDTSYYLGNRSIRDFLKDCQSMIASIKNNKIDYETLMSRFSPDDRNVLITKEQSLSYLWSEFIKIAKKNLKKEKSSDIVTSNNWPRYITDLIYDDYSEAMNKKIYRRLWLQKYYLKDNSTKVLNYEDKSDLKIEKSYNLAGALELAMRSYIPMYIFETIVRNTNIEYSTYDMINLSELAEKDLMEVAYDLSVMEIALKKEELKKNFDPSKYKLFGSVVVSLKKNELLMRKYNIPFLFKLKNQDQLFDSEEYISHQISFVSIFKAIALFIEILKFRDEKEIKLKEIEKKYKDSNKEKEKKEEIKKLKNREIAIFEKYRINMPCLNDREFSEKYFEEDFYIGSKDEDGKTELEKNLENILQLDFSETKFGVMEIVEFSKRVVDYFFEIRSNTNLGFSFSETNFKKHTWFCKKNPNDTPREKKCFVCDKLNDEDTKGYYIKRAKINEFVTETIEKKEGSYIKNIKNNIYKDNKCLRLKDNNNVKFYEENDYQELQNKQDEKRNMLEDIGTLSEYFDYPLSAYLSGFSQALLISLVKSSPKIENENISIRNSIHGANIVILKQSEDGYIALSRKSSLLFSNLKSIFSKLGKDLGDNDLEIYGNDNVKSKLFDKEIENKVKNKSLLSICKFLYSYYHTPFFKLLFDNYKNISPTEKCVHVTSERARCNAGLPSKKESENVPKA